VTIDQLIYEILGGAGFGLLIAAVANGLVAGRGRPAARPGVDPTTQTQPTGESPTETEDPVFVSVTRPASLKSRYFRI
jgi:hypothetical protein